MGNKPRMVLKAPSSLILQPNPLPQVISLCLTSCIYVLFAKARLPFMDSPIDKREKERERQSCMSS